MQEQNCNTLISVERTSGTPNLLDSLCLPGEQMAQDSHTRSSSLWKTVGKNYQTLKPIILRCSDISFVF